MVRSVLLTHGLNHHRAGQLTLAPEFCDMVRSLVTAGKTTLRILFCQDGLPDAWKEKNANPGADAQTYWESAVKKVAPHVTDVEIIDWSFHHPGDRRQALESLKTADIFYIRGTGHDKANGEDTDSYLVDITEDPDCAELVLALQYEVLQNRLVYVGVCGAAKWAGDEVEMWRGGKRRGLQLFGRGISVDYAGWQKLSKKKLESYRNQRSQLHHRRHGEKESRFCGDVQQEARSKADESIQG